MIGLDRLLRHAPKDARIFGAHPDILADEESSAGVAPEIALDDVDVVQNTLLAIRDGNHEGSGLYPVAYPVSDRLDLWANPSWMQNWKPQD